MKITDLLTLSLSLNLHKNEILQNCHFKHIAHDFKNFDNLIFKAMIEDAKTMAQDILEEENFSVVFSPHYTKYLILLLSLIATGSTLDEMKVALNIEKENTTDIIKMMDYGIWEDDLKFETFNMIFVDQNITVDDDFESAILRMVNVTTDAINFDNMTYAHEEINQLIAKRSKTFMREMFTVDDIYDAKNHISVFSNVYFKSDWLYPPTVLNDSLEYHLGKDKIKLSMFRMNGMMKYASISEIDAQVVDIPYKKCNISMLVFIPNKIDGMDDMEEKILNFDNVVEYANKFLEEKPVAITIPKYGSDSVTELPNKLKAVGIEKIFSEGTELENLTTDENAYLTVCNQRIMFWATHGRGAFKDTGDPEYPLPEKIVIADRPYTFFVHHKSYILFMGHFYKL